MNDSQSDQRYDDQDAACQDVTRQRWAEEIFDLRTNLNYEARFIAEGREYSEADADGTVIRHAGRT